MLEELEQVGLEHIEARFYLAVLGLDRPTVAEAASAANVTRTNGYDITKRLIAKGLVSTTEMGSRGKGRGSRTRQVLIANDPKTLIELWDAKKQVLDEIVPRLKAMQRKPGLTPRVRYLEGTAGIRHALFETLDWKSPLNGILSMRDLMAVPGTQAMKEYIDGRRKRGLHLRVVRSPERDFVDGWPTSERDLRETRYAPTGKVFTMTMIIGEDTVAIISSQQENFAMMIDSPEYASMQYKLFEILWGTSSASPPDSNQS